VTAGGETQGCKYIERHFQLLKYREKDCPGQMTEGKPKKYIESQWGGKKSGLRNRRC